MIGDAPRVLLCGRPDLLTKPGGDTRQLLSLERHLGPRARLSLELRPALDDIDLVHLFNLSRPVEPAVQLDWARRHGRPTVLTPIYQDLREYNRLGRHGAGQLAFRALGARDGRLETVRALLNLARAGGRGLRAGLPLLARGALERGAEAALALQAGILANSDLLVFNSALEEQTVQRCLPTVPARPSAVVPVGVDPDELAAADPRPFLRRYGLAPGFVLSVGRIEDIKNQLALIRALERERTLQLVLVGPPNPRHAGYVNAVARAAAARPRTMLVHRLERPLLLSAMAAAAVHVLPSWFETAGLVSLEAAALGCAVVSTDRGYARGHLGEDAGYCDPSAPTSIRRAVLDALERGPSAPLRRRVLERYTEAAVAGRMEELYRRVAGR